MGELADQIIEGSACELCLLPFVDDKNNIYEHGYPAVCWKCWKTLTPEEKKVHQRSEVKTI